MNGTAGQPELLPHCLICGSVMIAIHCKYACRNCGFQIDCSDTEIEPDWRPADAPAPAGREPEGEDSGNG